MDEMTRLEELIVKSYQELVILTERQYEIAIKTRYDDQFIELEKYENMKQDKSKLVQQYVEQVSSYQVVSDQVKEVLASMIDRLLQLNRELSNLINQWYSEDSKTMKQVSLQRKTLQVYGGLHDSDYISYYMDEKK